MPSVRSVWRMPEVSQPVGRTPVKSSNILAQVRISSRSCFRRQLCELNVFGVGMADDLMAALMHRFYRFGIAMNAKRIGVERRLDAVLVEDAQNPPHAGAAAVIVFTRRSAVVLRHHVVFLDRIGAADMMRAPVLGIGDLGPRFQISRQRDRQARAVGPFDLELFRLGINIVKIIMLRASWSGHLLYERTKLHRLGISKSTWCVNAKLRVPTSE